MATIDKYQSENIGIKSGFTVDIRSVIGTSFYSDKVLETYPLIQAYLLTINTPGTVIGDIPMKKPLELGAAEESTNVIIWLMNDPAFPPVLRFTGPKIAATMGALLGGKHQIEDSERNQGLGLEKLELEPYSNEFKVHTLEGDYWKFKTLLEEEKLDCYMINTSSNCENALVKEISLSILGQIIEGTMTFKDWSMIDGCQVTEIEGDQPKFDNEDYVDSLVNSLNERKTYLKNNMSQKGHVDLLPQEAIELIGNIEKKLKERKNSISYMRTCNFLPYAFLSFI